jgi:hypothetical protein
MHTPRAMFTGMIAYWLLAGAQVLAVAGSHTRASPPSSLPAAFVAQNAKPQARETEQATVPVTVENFVRAESDLYFSGVVREGGFGKFHHNREPTPIDRQTVIRMNRDTLYSAAVFDLDAGPVTITLPDAAPLRRDDAGTMDSEGGVRFMSMQIINEDHYTSLVAYGGTHTLTRASIGTRYVLAAVRTLVNPAVGSDVQAVHALQDAIKVEQKAVGPPAAFEIPNWDQAGQKKVREALLVLGATLPDSTGMFGAKADVDPVRFLIGAAMAWGGNPEQEAKYLNITPPVNDGTTISRLTVRDVPVDGFWSISVYNADGYFEPNALNAYTINNLTARKDADGSVTVQFGGCDEALDAHINCLPITPGWNYIVRLYRPRAEILEGKWSFPSAKPVK